MNDQKTLIEDLICFGSRYDLESCSLAAKVIEEQEKLIRRLQSENESGRATIRQLEERKAWLESSRAKEAQTADAMIGLEKAARNELERFKKDWSVLRSESCVLDRENKNLRADLERAQTEAAAMREALEKFNQWWFAQNYEADGPILISEEDVGALAFAARRAVSPGAGAALLAEVTRLREVERLAKAYRSAVTERRAHKGVDPNTDDSPLGTKWGRRMEELTDAKRAAGEALFAALDKETTPNG